MTWIERHQESERLATEAEAAARTGDAFRAQRLYAFAADAEEAALEDLESNKPRTLGISAVSAVALRYKAGQHHHAENIAYRWLATGSLPNFAVVQLKELLEAVWAEISRDDAGVRFAPGQVIVSVKGGEVIRGGAPLDLIIQKVQTVKALFHRTAEFLQGLPHRTSGGASEQIQEMFRPWLFQTAPGSYQFAVAVQEPPQGDFLRVHAPTPAEVSDRFLKILRASAEDPEGDLPALVPDATYRSTFLKLTRNLAPTGKTFDQLDVRSPDQGQPISLVPATRRAISDAVRKTTSRQSDLNISEGPEETLRGVLRALHLNDDWLEVSSGDLTVRIYGVGEAVDDVIGPMVNRPVVIRLIRDARTRPLFRDIELEE